MNGVAFSYETERDNESLRQNLSLVIGPGEEEAFSRIEHLIERGGGGALLCAAPGAGKTRLLRFMEQDLHRTSVLPIFIDLAGISSDELLFRLAEGWGLCPDTAESPLRRWVSVSDAVASHVAAARRTVLLLDHADQAAQAPLTTLDRILSLAGPTAGLIWIAATRHSIPTPLAQLADRHAELRVELPFSKETVQEDSAYWTSEARDAAEAASAGSLRQWNRLQRFLHIATHDSGTVEQDDVQAAMGEIRFH